ncbi:L-aspartate oxidase [Thalassobacillus hwangdonensis]|uniref:L-aspartate oxidase n=1 Tax=Thalassobacillus hwangdonensis TaxID=546108 RepID=A0ABW3KZV8_9BACI
MNYDVIVIGSGIAALQLVANLRTDLNVIVLTKSKLSTSNSSMAQGGIAAAIGSEDDTYTHFVDTMEAGNRLNDQQAVYKLTKAAPSIIEDLIQRGCSFDQKEDGALALGLEGAHRHHRILHSGGDQTGKSIVKCLRDQIGNNVTVIENLFVFELLIGQDQKCYGVKGKDGQEDIHTFYSNHVVLATGGCGNVYALTSNAATVTGDGLALAYQAGAALMDMEFIQFHPTMLYIQGRTKGLISEAVRGEGAVLVTDEGRTIMDHHPLGDLAPRHIVSQRLYETMKKGKSVYLDIRSIDNFDQRFPTISKLCISNGISLSEGLIPVAPGAHFLMGGIQTDEKGSTTVQGLYAIGEVACTGVHGANRLASNSLLEGLVYGKKLATHLNKIAGETNSESVLSLKTKQRARCLPYSLPPLKTLQQQMMQHVGIVRTMEGLRAHQQWLETFNLEPLLDMELEALSKHDISLVFSLITAWLITSSASQRTESRGAHFMNDYPFEQKAWKQKHIVQQRRKVKEDTDESIEAATFT